VGCIAVPVQIWQGEPINIKVFFIYKYSHIDTGNCRTYYKANKKLFCFQNEDFSITFYECSKDGEPSHSVKIPSKNFLDIIILRL